jgi:hypothetical protein
MTIFTEEHIKLEAIWLGYARQLRTVRSFYFLLVAN